MHFDDSVASAKTVRVGGVGGGIGLHNQNDS